MGTVVETTLGRLEGTQHDGVERFAGIPFAAAPLGELRFMPAQAHQGWTGVRDAAAFGAVAMQTAGTLESLAGGGTPDWSEDCLFLNVWTPACDGAARPVMVWIHGGGFSTGAGSIPWYDGQRLASKGDVVVVTINYRLGALGWLHLDHLDASLSGSGNAGLTDQIAALSWVRDNIAAFGGDPGNVTIFGESAGGMSVGTLMGTPAAQGLFHKAIAQSGAAHNVSTPELALEVTERMLDGVGAADLAALRAVDAARFLEVQSEVAGVVALERARRTDGSAGLGLPFVPVHDGVVLPRPPLDQIRDGMSASVPLLAGTTAEEWKLFGLMLRDVEDEATILKRLGRVVEDPAAVAAAYRQAGDDPSHDDVWTAIMTDRIFRIPCIRLLEAQAVHQPANTFGYLFEWRSTAFEGRLGSCHALEIPFVFDNLDKPGVAFFTGDDAPQTLSDAMSAAWLAFARAASPAHEGIPAWPAYDASTRATMHFGTTAHLEHDPGAQQRAAWDGAL
jgi:para-nitrobenzyl esterase